jgi:hypothetical protein
MPMNLSVSTSGPRDSDYALELAEALPEIVRVLNYVTLEPAVLTEPSEAGDVLRYLATAASRLPQLLSQINRRLENWQPAEAVGAVRDELARAAALAGQLEVAFVAAARATRRMRPPGGAE